MADGFDFPLGLWGCLLLGVLGVWVFGLLLGVWFLLGMSLGKQGQPNFWVFAAWISLRLANVLKRFAGSCFFFFKLPKVSLLDGRETDFRTAPDFVEPLKHNESNAPTVGQDLLSSWDATFQEVHSRIHLDLRSQFDQ